MNEDLTDIVITCAGRADELAQAETVPADVWQSFGQAGLFGLGVPEEYGGRGGGYGNIAGAAHVFAAGCGVLGLATSWSLQSQIARFFFFGFGSEAQKREFLPKLVTGETTVSVAISEPDAGAHPKRLSTRAERAGDDFIVSGQKHWLTNGPMADLFLVLAITAEAASRKRFSLLLIPRATPGLEIIAMPALDFLRPSPHCGLRLANCRVPASALLGPEGEAFESMARPLRDVEDAVMASALAGAMAWQLRRLANHVREFARSDAQAETIGALQERLAVLKAVAERAASELDAAPLTEPPQSDLAGGFRLLAADFQEVIADGARGYEFGGDPGLERVTKDITMSLGIAGEARAIRRRRLGQALIEEQ